MLGIGLGKFYRMTKDLGLLGDYRGKGDLVGAWRSGRCLVWVEIFFCWIEEVWGLGVEVGNLGVEINAGF